MNKVLSISLTVFLMTSVIGVTVNTHYCHGVARYSAIATNADHESCCGDDMNACPSCEDHISSNVMDEESVITAVPEQEAPLVLDVAFTDEHAAASGHLMEDALHAYLSKPPGWSSGITVPVLFQSFLN